MRSSARMQAQVRPLLLRSQSAVLHRDYGTRARVLRLSETLGNENPNFVIHFNDKADLGEHWFRRAELTVKQRLGTFALLLATDGDASRVQVTGATMQDRSGRSRIVSKDGKSYCLGYQHGHVAIGGYRLEGKPVVAKVVREYLALAKAAGFRMEDLPAFTRLLGYCIHTSAATEAVPAFFNQSSGVFERSIIEELDAFVPLPMFGCGSSAERSLLFACQQALAVFDPKAMVGLFEKRLSAIETGDAKEYLQLPTDTQNLLCGGKETAVLEETCEQLQQRNGVFTVKYERLERSLAQVVSEIAQLGMLSLGECAQLTEKAELRKIE